MGFLGLFRKEKKPEVLEPKSEESVSLKLKDLGTWFEDNFSKDIDKSKSRGGELFQNVTDSISNLRNSFVSLESARFSGRERVHAAANMIKDSYVKKAYPIITNIEKVSRETGMSYSGLNDFVTEVTKTIETLKKTTPKQAVLMSRYFKKESEPIKSSMKEVNGSIDSLKTWLDEEVTLRLLESIKKKTGYQVSGFDEMKSLEKRKNDIKNDMIELKKKKQDKESEYLELLKGNDWKSFNSMEKEIKDIKNDIMKIESDLTNELSPMKRPLKKLEHTLRKHDIMFNHKGFLKGFIQDPFGSIKTKNGEDSLRSFLFTMNKMFHDNKIELKDKERERMDVLLEKMVREIPEIKKKYNDLVQKRENTEKRIRESSVIVKKKDELESDVEKYSRYTTDMEKELKDVSREQEKLKEEMHSKVKDLEKLILKETGREVEIVG